MPGSSAVDATCRGVAGRTAAVPYGCRAPGMSIPFRIIDHHRGGGSQIRIFTTYTYILTPRASQVNPPGHDAPIPPATGTHEARIAGDACGPVRRAPQRARRKVRRRTRRRQQPGSCARRKGATTTRAPKRPIRLSSSPPRYSTRMTGLSPSVSDITGGGSTWPTQLHYKNFGEPRARFDAERALADRIRLTQSP